VTFVSLCLCTQVIVSPNVRETQSHINTLMSEIQTQSHINMMTSGYYTDASCSGSLSVRDGSLYITYLSTSLIFQGDPAFYRGVSLVFGLNLSNFHRSPWKMGNLSFFICTSPWFKSPLFWRLISLKALTTDWHVCYNPLRDHGGDGVKSILCVSEAIRCVSEAIRCVSEAIRCVSEAIPCVSEAIRCAC
jgi:hypothetical protein